MRRLHRDMAKTSKTLAQELIHTLEQIFPRTVRFKEQVILHVDNHFKGKLPPGHSYLIEDGLYRALGLPEQNGYTGTG